MGKMVKHMKDQSREWLSWKKNPTLERQAVTFKLQKEIFKNKFNVYLWNTDIQNGVNTVIIHCFS